MIALWSTWMQDEIIAGIRLWRIQDLNTPEGVFLQKPKPEICAKLTFLKAGVKLLKYRMSFLKRGKEFLKCWMNLVKHRINFLKNRINLLKVGIKFLRIRIKLLKVGINLWKHGIEFLNYQIKFRKVRMKFLMIRMKFLMVLLKPDIVVGRRRNNGEEWAYVMPTVAKLFGCNAACQETRRRRLTGLGVGLRMSLEHQHGRKILMNFF